MGWNYGGAGGGLVGGNGVARVGDWPNFSWPICNEITGGTQTTGGTNSLAGSECAGSLYQGGGCSMSNVAGGGGGYYGGAGGQTGGCSGGGGSSYSSGTILSNLQGVHSGNGNVTIIFYVKPHCKHSF